MKTLLTTMLTMCLITTAIADAASDLPGSRSAEIQNHVEQESQETTQSDTSAMLSDQAAAEATPQQETEAQASEFEFSGNIGLEIRHFPQDALYPGQEDGGFSVSVQPEIRKRWDNDRKAFTFIPFYRWDEHDDERSHGDIRQLDATIAQDNWEFQVGISKVFWGVTESQHLVDIINQTDTVENVDGEDKLGQPMLRISRFLENGSVGLYILPYFRERTFPGVEGRLRTPLVVDADAAIYESDDEEKHIDYALRWEQTLDDIDLGLSYFDGTSREPELLPNGLSFSPYYRQIRQLGMDLQYTSEEWLWKLEALRRETRDSGYNAAVGGFEYTFPGITESGADLGVLAEYHVDSRDEQGASPFQNDLFLGARLAMNDEQSTEMLAGAFVDLDHNSKSFRVEASRRIGDNVKVNLEAQVITDADPADPAFYTLRNDDLIQLEIQRFF